MASRTTEAFDHVVVDDRTGAFKDRALEFSDEVHAATAARHQLPGYHLIGRLAVPVEVEALWAG